MPFALLGFDTDNDSVFMNETVKTYCEEAGLVFTRCRPYRKNDQAWVEQKNGAVVRHAVGYRRYEGLEAAAALARLYTALRLFVNFFQPSFKLAAKTRDGAKVKKTYHPPATPLSATAGRYADQRGRTAPGNGDLRHAGSGSVAANDPRSAARAGRNRRPSGHGRSGGARPPTLEHFLSGLRTAWQDGEVRPTKQAEGEGSAWPTASRPVRDGDGAGCVNGSRPSHGAHRANCLSGCKKCSPASSLMGNCRTLQRRLKEWRHELAHKMVFGAGAAGETREDRTTLLAKLTRLKRR